MLIQLDRHFRAMQSLRARSITVIAHRLSFLGRKIPLLPTKNFYLPRFITGVLSNTQIIALIKDLNKMALSKDQVTDLYMSIEASKLNDSYLSIGIINKLMPLNSEMALKLFEKYEDKFSNYQILCFIEKLLDKDPETAVKILKKYEDKFNNYQIMCFIKKLLDK
ncbi:MAG: hypothetical protein K1060chlam4_00434, partial [Candidatus Anoxychlamydiales bacterium]|nr:hypothetical protein [Candidatus Anoxychlamydiales bacterium]